MSSIYVYDATSSRTHFSKAWYVAATYLTTLNVFPLKPITRHPAYTEKKKKNCVIQILFPCIVYSKFFNLNKHVKVSLIDKTKYLKITFTFYIITLSTQKI